MRIFRNDRINVPKNAIANGTGQLEGMAQWLETLAALSEDSGLIPSTGMRAHSGLYREFQGFEVLPLYGCRNTHGAQNYLQAKYPYTLKS